VRKLANISAAVFNDVNFVPIVNSLNSRKGNAGLSPEPTQDDLLATRSLDRRDEVLVIPGVHRGTLDRLLFREHGSYLGPKITTKAFRFYCRQYDRKLEELSGFRECHCVIYDRLAIEVANPEQHLRLMIYQSHYAIIWGQ
jgi:hypothetical protein